MNKEFKVGQRIWIKDMKEFGTIVEINGDDYYSDLKNGIDFSHFDNVHQTANDMFEELGYVRDNKEMPYIVFEKSMLSGRTMRIIFYPADKSYRANLQVLPKEHQAIHQKLIELGWIE